MSFEKESRFLRLQFFLERKFLLSKLRFAFDKNVLK